ncbi:hypothetical protein DXA38_07550 [[Clostridium] innocuum]|uniref:Uncharacterized protein n=8 Tax=Bacillota TaxID=1239 RepID=A0A3E2VYN1_CLOIN|nr:hypothetical protein [[Clostridium] innocuum]RGC16529.1 hypothetical protein DXA38_07550 [[Clostridium] innocuum]
MKRKHKIGIAAGVISLSMVTAMATGLINTGNLFAEDPKSIPSSVQFQPGDMVNIGGKQFTVLNDNQLLAYDNAADNIYFDEVPDILRSWEESIKSTGDSAYLSGNAELSDAVDITDVPNLGNGTNSWTGTAGTVDGTIQEGFQQVLGPDGKIAKQTLEWSTLNGEICVGEEVSTDWLTSDIRMGEGVGDEYQYGWVQIQRNYNGAPYYTAYKTMNYVRYQDETWDEAIERQLRALPCGNSGKGCWENAKPGIDKPAGPPVTGTLGIYVWGSHGPLNPYGDLVPAGPCGTEEKKQQAAVRPVISADLSSITYVKNSSGTPVNADPQTEAVNLVMHDSSIDFTMNASQSKKIEAISGDTIKLNYESATTGENHSIKLIVKDESGKIIRYAALEDLSSGASGEVSINTGADGLNLELGSYTFMLVNEQDNSAVSDLSDHSSAPVEIPVELQHNLTAADIMESGNKVEGSDFYNEGGVSFAIKDTAENGNISSSFPYIRVGTLEELNDTTNPIPFASSVVKYTNDGVYERVSSEDTATYPDGYDYSGCLYVQLADSSDGSGNTTIKVPIDSVKIDTMKPYFPTGKNGEDKAITTENIKEATAAKTSFFDAVFSDQPSADLDEEFAGEHTKIIPHAKDYAATMYEGGKLKADATSLKGGIEKYELSARALKPDGTVDEAKAAITQTIQTNEEKFKDVEPYFELKGKDAYWIQITAYDRAGRTISAEEKLYMDSTIPGKPVLKAELQNDDKTEYPGGVIENEQGEKIANWSNQDISITLSLSEEDEKELKSGIDRWEYITSEEIKAWVDDGHKAEDITWKSLGKKTEADGSESKEAQSVFTTDSNKVSETGEYHFRAVSRANIKGTEAVFNIKKDKTTPELNVKAIDVATKSDYQENMSAEKGIIFTVTPVGTIPASGVSYYYRGVPSNWSSAARAADEIPSDEEIPWIKISKNDKDEYSFMIADDFEGTYYFKAVSGANVTTKAVDVKKVKADVGVEQPKTPITVSAVMSEDGTAYNGKWTNKDITVTISGGLDGSDTPAYYEYADSPTSTSWKKISAVDGVFQFQILGEQTIDKAYYFRVIKNGDDDEIPYSTTKNGLRIRHDQVVPMIKTVTLSPQSPDVATSYVTLKVNCIEKSAEEAANASPIAAYSVDGGATWITANSKNPNTFVYEFNENIAGIEVQVKDEAGNITSYDEILAIDNIDKTGPSAPEFANIDEFKNGVWKNAAQDVTISFTPADTGAKEHIQYHIQKLVGDTYVEYEPVSDSTGGDLTWINAPIDQAVENVALDKEGTYRIIARTIDSMKRVSAESMTTDIIRIDMTAPTLTDITQVEDKWAAAATNFLSMLTGETFFKDHITYTFSGTDNAGGSGLQKYQYQMASADTALPADDKWIDAYKGEVNIEEDFSGKLFARSVDYAGNVSDVKVYDGIHVDATLPVLTITPTDLSANWTNKDSITISASDAGSGIKDNKVSYTTTYAGTEAFADDSLTLDANGKAVLNNLPDGEYSITFTVNDNSLHEESVVYPVRIDKELPDIAIIDPNKDTIVSEKEVTIEVQNTQAGQKELNVTLNGKEVSGLTLSSKAPEVLSGDHIKVYTIKINENGRLETEVIGNTIRDGVNVSAIAASDITNVYSVTPVLKLEAFVGRDENADRYVSGEWTTEHVEVVLSNTESGVKTSDLTFQYQCYDREGNEITHGWTNIEDTETSTKAGRFSVYGNGVYEYRFRAVMIDPDDPARPPLLESDVETIVIAQDTKRPAAPTLEIANADDYTQTKWYDAAKLMEINFTANTDGLGQWVEYIDSSDKSPKWTKAKLNTTSGKYEIRIKGDKQHVIRIRSNDAYDRTSVESIAYVNIDTSTPEFDVKKKFTSSNAILTLVTTDADDKSTIGISGVYDATIQKKTDGVLVPDTLQHFYGGKATITKDSYGNGTYEVVLTTNSGKTVKKDIEVNGINLPKPVISVNAAAIAVDDTEVPYTSGTWTTESKVRLDVEVKNPTTAGAVTNEYQEDGDSTWTAFANDGTDQSMLVSGAGKHTINIRSTNASGAVSDVYSFKVWIDTAWNNDFTIQNEADFSTVDTPWYNKTQTVRATFTKDVDGCKEWIEYSEDGLTWTHNSKNTYEVNTTGKHEIFARKNDEIGSGNSDIGKPLHVYIDKETIKDFKIKIDKNSYASFLSTITFGVYQNEVKDATITGDFGISGADKVYIQIVSDPADYVNTYAADAGEAGWQEYTAPIQLENNFKGFVYAKAKDKAGNTSNIIRTDGIVIDTVGPTVEINNKDGAWITEDFVDITVSDFADAAASIVGNASGITSIDYETNEAEPVEGSIDIEENHAVISGLHDGEYDLQVIARDKAGNETREIKPVKLDRIKPGIAITGYNELSFTSVNKLKLIPSVGVSGIQSVMVKAELKDGSAIAETEISGPEYTYTASKNGTYTFLLTNNAGVTVEETLEIDNITDSLDDIMGLDVKTTNLKGEEIDYLHAEELADTAAEPNWSAHDVIFIAHGATKFKASIDNGKYTDFSAAGTFTVKNEGIHTVRIKNDADTTTRTFIVKIDKYEVKDVKIKDSHKYTATEWYNNQRVIQASFVPDDTTGIDEWLEYYDPSDNEWKKGDSVILNVDGSHTVRFRGNDELNRPTAEQTAIVNLDMTAPTDMKIKIEKSLHKEFINYFFPNTYDETVEVTLHANGDISGIEKIQYQLINEEAGETFNPLIGWNTYDSSFTISDGFKGKIYARATDKAGNQTINVVTEDGIIVDTKEPVIAFQESYPMTAWSSENSVKATITPTLSGLQSAWYTITKNGIVTKYDIDLKDIDASNNITLENLPNGKYDIEVFAKNKAGKIGSGKFEDAMFENRAPLLKVDAELEKKVSSIPVSIDVDMSSLYTTLESLTWQTSGTSAQDILTDKKFTINSNGVYKIVATTSSGVTAEKTLVVTNITNVSSVIGINAYFSEEPTKEYLGGNTWSSKDVTIEVRDTTGKVPVDDLMMQMKVTNVKDGSLVSDWTAMEADKNDAALYKTVASDEGSYLYEFRGSYEGVSGSTAALRVNIDRSAPKKPLYTEDTLKKYDNDAWHSEYDAELEALIDATDGCDEWLEYNIDGATDYDGNLLWIPTKNQKTDTIKVVDDKDHIVQIRTTDRLERHSEVNEIHVKLDSTRPTNFYIKEGENLYQDFLDKLTGGNFYQKSRTVEIGGDFKIAGVDKIEYQIVKKESDFDATKGWEKLKIADGAESSTITLLPGTKGIIYARGVDKAGNETGIIRTDLITIDNSRADLIVPDDATAWTDVTTMKIKVKDDESGLRSVTYNSEDPAQSGEVILSDTVDADGYREGTITNLKDGQYLVDVVATNGAGEPITRKVRVMIDTVTPGLKVEGESSKPQTSTTLDLIPVVGGSGLDEIQQLKKNDDDTFTVIRHIKAVDGQDKYPETFIENGTYYYQVVNGAGTVSTPVTEITISNIKSDKPVIVFRSDNGYDSKTWSGRPVTLEVNTNTNAKLYYRKKGDAAYIDADHVYYQNLKFDKTGIYTYEFKSVFEGVGGAADIETVEEYSVKVDLEAPKKPSIENLSDYDQWFRLDKKDPANPKGKIVTLIRDTSDYVNGGDITKYGDGSKETVYYHIDGDDDASGNPNWIELDGDSVEIKKVGDNIVTFKIVDEVKGHETLSDPLHVKIYEENPTITLSSTTKPVKTMNLGIKIDGPLAKEDQIKKLTVERVGSDVDEIELEQDSMKYNYPISKNGTYIIRVEMEFGGKAEETLPVTNIIEEDPILTVTASDAATGTAYKFGEWAKADVKLKVADTKADPNLKIEFRNKVKGGTYSLWQDYTGEINIDTTGTHIYQFKTVITKGSDTYETVMDETFAVKVDKEEPGDVTINEFATYKNPNKWVSDSVNITTKFDPDLNGADEWVEYTMDGGTTWTKKNSVFITDEGIHTITFRSADELGRTHSVTNDTVYVNIDKTSAGTLSMKIGSDAAVTGKPNNITFDHFYKSSDTVALEFTDSKGNKVTDGTIYYQFADNRNGMVDDAKVWKTYDPAHPFKLTKDFRGSIYAYAVNKSGKATDVIRSNGITVDDTAPEIKQPTADMTTWSKSSKLPVEITDGLSGIDQATVKYQKYDASGNSVGSKTVISLIDGKGTIDLSDGEYDIEIEASDKAGNSATPVRVKVMIDAAQASFTTSYALDGSNAFATISATVTSTPLSGIQGIYIRGNGSSWQLMDTKSPASFKVYKNGAYDVKVVNGAGKDSTIQHVNVTGIVNDLPDYTIKTTDGFTFGDFWYKELTIWVDAPDADEIYYSTNGKDGPWKIYKDKIEILETSAYQFTFKIVKDGNELITLPYDTRVIRKQADGSGTPSVITHRNVRNYMRSVFTAFSDESETKWLNTSSRIKFPISSSTAPGLKAGTYVQILEADENGNGIGYDENNFTLVDDDDPFYTFHQEGKYVVYQYYAYYKEGEEDRPSKPDADKITKSYFNIDGTAPDSLKLTAEVDGSSTILNNLTGGLFFKEPIVIIPQGSDSLSGIDHYEFQSVACSGEECDTATPKDNKWKTAETFTVPQDFEGYVYVRAADAAEPANYLEKSVQLAVKDDTTTYKILEDISDWTNTRDLNIEVTPSTTGLQELNYKVFAEDKEEDASRINIPATDTENKLFTIHDIPEGVYNLKVIPVENGGTSINRGAHSLKVDRTKPVVQVKLEQSNQDTAAKLMNTLTLNSFYQPGLMVSASATDLAGALQIDPQELKIEYSLHGAAWKDYTSPLTFDDEEVISVSFRAIDPAGNISEVVTQDGIAVDATAPSFEGAGNNMTYWLPRTVSVKDGMSGVDTVKLNDQSVGSRVLVKDYGTSRIEAKDRSGNESAIAFTIKGLDGIKDEDITNDLIDAIEKEFEEQKPGYDKDLADKIQQQIDDLKNRNQDPSDPGNNGQGNNDGSNQKPDDGNGNGNSSSGDGTNGGGSAQTPGTDGSNGGSGSGNGADGTGTGTKGSGTGSGNSNGSSNGTSMSSGQGTSVMSGNTRTPVASGTVKTGDGSSIFALLMLGVLSLLLAGAVKLKQRLNALHNR